jgi:hypothetical protein
MLKLFCYFSFFCCVVSWYFERISREEAEEILLLPINQYGSYLIHKGSHASDSPSYTLSVRGEGSIQHYQIHQFVLGGFYRFRDMEFRDLPDLVAHYTRDADDLGINLKNSCRRVLEIPHSSIKFLHLLGIGLSTEVFEGVWNGAIPVAVKRLRVGMPEDDFLNQFLLSRLKWQFHKQCESI